MKLRAPATIAAVVLLHAGLLVWAIKLYAPQFTHPLASPPLLPLTIQLASPGVTAEAPSPQPAALPRKLAAATTTSINRPPIKPATTNPAAAPTSFAMPPAPAPAVASTTAAAPSSPVAAPASPPVKTGASISASYAASNRKPQYPPMSERFGEQGTVMLRILVAEDGTASAIELKTSSGYPLLDEAAKNAVRSWRFIPATSNGKPIAEWYLAPIPFTLAK